MLMVRARNSGYWKLNIPQPKNGYGFSISTSISNARKNHRI
jgi:hypothetical protein